MNIDHGKRDWTSEELDGLREAIQDVMRTAGLSQAEVGRRSQVSGPTLSQFMKGEYRGDNGRVALDLRRWLDAHNRETEFRLTAPPEPSFVRTPTALKVQTALQHAQLLNDTAVIVGPPGVGKTSAVEQYASATPRVFLITASPSISKPSAVLGEIINRYSPDHRRSERSLSARSNVVRMLLLKGTLLVVDEAQHLTPESLEELRAIHDANKCGLVFMGNRTVLSRIQGSARDATYAQLFGRVGRRVQLAKGSEKDVAPVLETMGVDAPDVLAVATSLAKKEDLRVVVKVTRSAILLANGARENLEPKHMRAAYRELAGDAQAAA